jgi:hypothetical protein
MHPPRIILAPVTKTRGFRFVLVLLAGLSLCASANGSDRWGTNFAGETGLPSSGWKNFLGAREGKPRILFQGRGMAGKPPENAFALSLDVSGTVDWFGGLYLPLPAMPANQTSENLRIRARVAQSHGSTIMIRFESSPQNWIGVLVDTPEEASWVDVDMPLSEGIRRGTGFNPLSDRLRLVVAFVDDGRNREAGGDPKLYLSSVWLDVSGNE